MMAQPLLMPAQASTAMSPPPASVKPAPMATVRNTPRPGKSRRHRKVPPI